jgi:hypothetical protein
MDRMMLKKLLGLNLSIAAANIIIFSPEFIGLTIIGAGALEAAFGLTAIIMSGVGLTYGNYRLLSVPKVIDSSNKIMTADDYVDELNSHEEMKTFKKTIDILLDQIGRLQKKNKTIRGILLQIFSASEMSYQKFDAVISEVEKIFYMNIRSILNKINSFDEEDYEKMIQNNKEGVFSQQFMEDKFKVYYEYIEYVNAAVEDNEQILLKLDKLSLEISDLISLESGELEKMPEMIEIDNLIKQAKYYKN